MKLKNMLKKLFLNGVEIPESAEPSYTDEQLKSSNKVLFQPAFITKKGQFARIDILEKLSDDSFHIYEIKSSTSIKTDKKHNHLKDACFLKIYHARMWLSNFKSFNYTSK